MGRAEGISDEDMADLHRFRESDRFSARERAAIELAEAMTAAPAEVSDELRAELRRHFSDTQITELASAIAWENHRARLNRALGVRAVGFSDGAYCVMPS